MAAEKGSKWWTLRQTHGKPPTYTPETLKTECIKYFKDRSETFIEEQQWVGKDGREVKKKHPVPFTLYSLCTYLGISFQTWQNYKAKDNYVDIITHVEQIVFDQKFSYASAGFFKENIISRELGLKDTSIHEIEDKRKSVSDLFPEIPEEGNEEAD